MIGTPLKGSHLREVGSQNAMKSQSKRSWRSFVNLLRNKLCQRVPRERQKWQWLFETYCSTPMLIGCHQSIVFQNIWVISVSHLSFFGQLLQDSCRLKTSEFCCDGFWQLQWNQNDAEWVFHCERARRVCRVCSNSQEVDSFLFWEIRGAQSSRYWIWSK